MQGFWTAIYISKNLEIIKSSCLLKFMKKFNFWKVTHWKLASEVKSIIHLITCQALIYVNDNFKNSREFGWNIINY